MKARFARGISLQASVISPEGSFGPGENIFESMIDENKLYSFIASERPVRSRANCKETNWHGGAGYMVNQYERARRSSQDMKGSPEGDFTFCLTCHTIVTDEDIKMRVEKNGGPGHWLGCKLDKDHDGDCLVGVRRS